MNYTVQTALKQKPEDYNDLQGVNTAPATAFCHISISGARDLITLKQRHALHCLQRKL